ncbi:choice-of-anchor D domain-containing protein [Silvibacterium sp.]|uniref:choice-of-anchor D domain-containing protein n=1 Tax=Silvibacterium sp. TaxID=1964179 RepID=UPI0039E67DAF
MQSSQIANGSGNPATAVVWNSIRKLFIAAVRFHGFYQSPDGVTWTRMANQPGTNLTTVNCPANTGAPPSQNCPIFRAALAVQPVTGDLFALTVDQNNQDQGLWQDVCNAGTPTPSSCTNASVQWGTRIADTALEVGGGDVTIPQADYDLVLAAVPSQQDTLLFAGTYDLFRCSLANACAWRNTTNDQTCMASGVAPAQHAVDATAAAQGILYFGNDGGLWRSTDLVNQQQQSCSSDDATHFQNLNGGIGSLAEVESLAEDASNSANQMASLGSLGTAAPQSGGTPWLQVLDGFGSGAAIDPASPQNWYATSEFGVGINRCTTGSDCTLAGFGSVAIGSADVSGDGDTQTIPAPWLLDPQNTANVVLGTCRVWRGPGTGGWNSGSNLLSGMLDGDQGPECDGNAEIRSLAASGGSTEQIYAGMAGPLDGGESIAGHLFSASVSAQSGASTQWTDLALSPVNQPAANSSLFNPGGFDISSVYVDPHDATGNTVYATISAFSANGAGAPTIYRSVDGGAHWQNLTSTLPNVPVNSVVVDPGNANIVYLATDAGVWATTAVSDCLDTADSCWSLYGTSLPNAPAVQLAIYSDSSTSGLRVATYGRGIWQIPLLSSATALTSMSVTPASLSFNPEQGGTLSAPQQLFVKNTGSLALAITQISVTGDFTESDTCSAPVSPGDGCVVEVYFLPTATGTRTGVLTLFANVPTGQVTVPLSGIGLAPSSIVLTPVDVTFPTTSIGSKSPASNITISNTGGATATLTGESVSGDFSITANSCGSTLTANTGCTISVVFAPTASGTRAGALTVTDSIGAQTALLTGVGQSPPTDNLSPASLSFAAQLIGTVSAAQSITLTNSGDQALPLIATQVSGAFQVVNNCGTSLPGHSSCVILVQFVPQAVGSAQGTLTVSDALRVQTVSLSGAGLAPAGISAAPATLNFGNYGVGATSPPMTVTLTNNSSAGLSGLQYSIDGDFSLASGGCGSALTAAAACSLGIVFSLTQVGARSSTLTITGTGLVTALTVALSGSGEDFSLQVSGSSTATITSGQTATYMVQILPVSGSTGTVALSCSGAPSTATCTVNPASLTLNGVSNASATVTVTTGTSASAATSRMNFYGKAVRGGPMLLLALALPWMTIRRRFDARRMLRLLVLAVLLLMPIACGVRASGGSSESGGSGSGTTTSGNYSLTVTGTAPGVTHTVSLTLTVE